MAGTGTRKTKPKKLQVAHDKMLYNRELEEAVLGACILEQYAIGELILEFNPNVFYFEEHIEIAVSILNLYKANQPIDILTVSQDLSKRGKLVIVGGSFYVSSLTNRIASSANIQYHYKILQQHSLERILLEESQILHREIFSYDNDVFESYASHQQRLEGHLNGLIKTDYHILKDIHMSNVAETYDVIKSGKKSGVPSGLKQVDKLTSGWQKPDLIILAARPGMGKTTVALSWGLHSACVENMPTAMFSLEQSKEQLVAKAQSDYSGLNVSRILKKELTEEETRNMDQKCTAFYSAPLYIDDTAAISLLELKAKARRLVYEKKVKLIIIDYLQLMTSGADNHVREQEVSAISRGLKALAKELEIPIIALSQLSRTLESRPDKRPILSDLRESGAIEQDADQVIFVYRPWYYKEERYTLEGMGEVSSDGLGILIWAKHRGGELGEIPFTFIGSNSKVTDYNHEPVFRSSSYEKVPNQYKPEAKPETRPDPNAGFDMRNFVEPSEEAPTTSLQNNVDFFNQKGDDVF